MKAFVDTNVLVYALSSVNEQEAEKVSTAKHLLETLIAQNALVLSAQVLSEFIWTTSRKGRQPLKTVELALIVNDLRRQRVVSVDASLIQSALGRVEKSRISYWDALIVEAAIRSGATTLYTEDMHHGTRYGALQLINPFVS